MSDRKQFTLVFEGDLGKFKGNPFKTETAFGVPMAAGHGNAFEECDELRETVESLQLALRGISERPI